MQNQLVCTLQTVTNTTLRMRVISPWRTCSQARDRLAVCGLTGSFKIQAEHVCCDTSVYIMCEWRATGCHLLQKLMDMSAAVVIGLLLRQGWALGAEAQDCCSSCEPAETALELCISWAAATDSSPASLPCGLASELFAGKQQQTLL
jgi:hypothetical protein